MSTPDHLLLLRAFRFVEIGKFFASKSFGGRCVISLTDGAVESERQFEAVEQKCENVSDLLAGLELNSSDSENEISIEQVTEFGSS
jgi:hypothetical protein